MNCTNCHAKLSCGCQQRVATNGASCCTSCVAAYNQRLSGNNSAPVTPPPSGPPTNVTVSYNPGGLRNHKKIK